MSQLITNYTSIYDARLKDLDKLIETPNIIKQQALSTLKKLKVSKKLYHIDRTTVEQGIKVLDNISSGSICDNYRIIYAQLCVLATSVLEAILKEYFIEAISNVKNLNTNNERLANIKITAADLVDHKLDYTLEFPRLILENAKNEFQNLKKLKELFKAYLNKTTTLDDNTEKQVIFYLECRHAIVHKGSMADANFIRNITSYKRANLKKYKIKDRIDLSEQDWNNIKCSYRKLVENLTKRTN